MRRAWCIHAAHHRCTKPTDEKCVNLALFNMAGSCDYLGEEQQTVFHRHGHREGITQEGAEADPATHNGHFLEEVQV
jgi:hypothetical protein